MIRLCKIKIGEGEFLFREGEIKKTSACFPLSFFNFSFFIFNFFRYLMKHFPSLNFRKNNCPNT